MINLCLLILAGLRCFVLLTAYRRGEQVSAELAQLPEAHTEFIQSLSTKNMAITKAVHELTRKAHKSMAIRCSDCVHLLKRFA